MTDLDAPKCIDCDRDATHYEGSDMECGAVHTYLPCCDKHHRGDYEYCLRCYGHVDGNAAKPATNICFPCRCGSAPVEHRNG